MRILLIVYDNDSYIHTFPQGISYIAAVLLKQGYDVQIYNQDKFHYPDEHLTEYLNKNKFDVIGLGVIAGYYQYRKLLKVSEAIHRVRKRPFYILGGHGPTPEPEYFLRKSGADVAVLGEGEETIIELIDAVVNHKPLKGIRGIAYIEEDKIVVNPRRGPIQDVDTIPFPAYDLFPIDYYRLFRETHTQNTDFLMPVLTGRGCVFTCNFCYRMDTGFRPRSSKAIIDEINLLKNRYDINYIDFSDELLMSSKERTMLLCEDFIRVGLNIKWRCNGRLNYASPEVLCAMKKAGCVFINYGIESLDNQVLKNMRKGLNEAMIIHGIENTLKAGISPGLNIIFGNLGDSRETLEKSINFLLKYDDGAQMRTIRPVTPYPGSPLYDHAIQKGLLKDCADFYERRHINSDLLSVNFTDMSDEEFYQCLLEANVRLLTNYFQKKLANYIAQTRKLYLERDAAFRGFRQT